MRCGGAVAFLSCQAPPNVAEAGCLTRPARCVAGPLAQRGAGALCCSLLCAGMQSTQESWQNVSSGVQTRTSHPGQTPVARPYAGRTCVCHRLSTSGRGQGGDAGSAAGAGGRAGARAGAHAPRARHGHAPAAAVRPARQLGARRRGLRPCARARARGAAGWGSAERGCTQPRAYDGGRGRSRGNTRSQDRNAEGEGRGWRHRELDRGRGRRAGRTREPGRSRHGAHRGRQHHCGRRSERRSAAGPRMRQGAPAATCALLHGMGRLLSLWTGCAAPVLGAPDPTAALQGLAAAARCAVRIRVSAASAARSCPR